MTSTTQPSAAGNSRNGTRTKTVLTELGPVESDREGSFEPAIVPKPGSTASPGVGSGS